MPSVHFGVIGFWEVKVKRFGIVISVLAEFYSAVAPLREIQGHDKYDASFAVQMHGVADRCKAFINLEESKLFPAAKDQANELIRLRDFLLQLSIKEDKKGKDSRGNEIVLDGEYLSRVKDPILKDGIEQGIAESISKTAQRLLIALQNAINSLPLFLVESRGIFDIGKLIEAPEEALPKELVQWIEKNAAAALFDLREAGKCLAFGLATASGFHQMRFIESLLAPYYERLPKVSGTADKLRAKDSERNWGAYIKKLEARQAKDSVIKLLTHLKDDYRNPLMHPDDTLELTEATLLLGTVQGIANAVYADMKERNQLNDPVSS